MGRSIALTESTGLTIWSGVGDHPAPVMSSVVGVDVPRGSRSQWPSTAVELVYSSYILLDLLLLLLEMDLAHPPTAVLPSG